MASTRAEPDGGSALITQRTMFSQTLSTLSGGPVRGYFETIADGFCPFLAPSVYAGMTRVSRFSISGDLSALKR